MTPSLFLQHVTEHQAVCELVKTLEHDVDQVCRVIVAAVKAGGKIMLCGNGGSASDSQHIAAEFIGRFTKDREPIAALALTTDT
ncbi:MAG: SIS domain-containing protein, partial [Burkholderiales bacterium]